ncbi:MAG: monovalent cation/H(+) antiporter subunit G [Rickettsiaceae bacterium]|nr:monovalent cation/H(+) antiporter subunit G [Rickettsiaceae bacterium]
MVYFAWLFVIIGLFVIISGIIALYRFLDFYTKLHGASVIDCCGIPFCLFGLALMQDSYLNSFKLIAIIALIILLNPTAAHALARASVLFKVDKDGRVK